ncbi:MULTISPECIES: biotin--[acetyl-CoA-carboxylase] ligase [unclassified Methylophaga]|uniref:biotin--[acetyl-CoA-carboxylase] ligase n=1 Tax=unclassified Methylophaga TaxID=2629249 RepID=UPI000C895F15|nr:MULTISPECIES: biotin--[acetyl-CoA-carboxylase] ligase [unclassified Methylophaga]MBN45620.1 biotin--[acetyl-CoA-carboxylase] ligase [Methylophaga sp.]
MSLPPYVALNEKIIRETLPPEILHQLDSLQVFFEVTSTNDILWQKAQNGITGTSVCLAEMQTAGRGRRGTEWVSPASGNIYLSIMRQLTSESVRNGLSIAIGIALINTLREYGIDDLQLKWPNDVLHKRRKLAGILVESRYGSQNYVTVGIGLNLSLPDNIQTAIPQPIISLEQLCNPLPCRNRLAAKIIQNMIETLELFSHRGLNDFLPLWPQYDALHNQAINIISEDGQFTALACGINEQGELRYMRDQQVAYLSNSHLSIRFAS